MRSQKTDHAPMSGDEQAIVPIDPITRLTALSSPTGERPEGEIPMPSGEGFARQFFRAWTRRLMLLCAIVAIGLSVSVPLLSQLRVSSIEIDGQSYYSAETLTEALHITVGEELLAIPLEDTEQALLTAHPYLKTARLERTLSGRIRLEVTERTPAWALYLSEDRVALVDDSMWVLEITTPDRATDLCLVKWQLFTASDTQAGSLEVGRAYAGNPAAITKLNALAEAVDGLRLSEGPTLVDMTDPYAIRLQLSDGSTIALHEANKPHEQLRAALGALQAYRAQHQNQTPMLVDVDDFSRVTLRPLS